VQQRRIHDVGVADHPADIGGCKEHIARIEVVDGLHAVVERDRHDRRSSAHTALGLAGGTGGVEDVQRVAALLPACSPPLGCRQQHSPVVIRVRTAALRWLAVAEKQCRHSGLCADSSNGAVEQRFVFHHALGFDDRLEDCKLSGESSDFSSFARSRR